MHNSENRQRPQKLTWVSLLSSCQHLLDKCQVSSLHHNCISDWKKKKIREIIGVPLPIYLFHFLVSLDIYILFKRISNPQNILEVIQSYLLNYPSIYQKPLTEIILWCIVNSIFLNYSTGVQIIFQQMSPLFYAPSVCEDKR